MAFGENTLFYSDYVTVHVDRVMNSVSVGQKWEVYKGFQKCREEVRVSLGIAKGGDWLALGRREGTEETGTLQ